MVQIGFRRTLLKIGFLIRSWNNFFMLWGIAIKIWFEIGVCVCVCVCFNFLCDSFVHFHETSLIFWTVSVHRSNKIKSFSDDQKENLLFQKKNLLTLLLLFRFNEQWVHMKTIKTLALPKSKLRALSQKLLSLLFTCRCRSLFFSFLCQVSVHENHKYQTSKRTLSLSPTFVPSECVFIFVCIFMRLLYFWCPKRNFTLSGKWLIFLFLLLSLSLSLSSCCFILYSQSVLDDVVNQKVKPVKKKVTPLQENWPLCVSISLNCFVLTLPQFCYWIHSDIRAKKAEKKTVLECLHFFFHFFFSLASLFFSSHQNICGLSELTISLCAFSWENVFSYIREISKLGFGVCVF